MDATNLLDRGRLDRGAFLLFFPLALPSFHLFFRLPLLLYLPSLLLFGLLLHCLLPSSLHLLQAIHLLIGVLLLLCHLVKM